MHAVAWHAQVEHHLEHSLYTSLYTGMLHDARYIKFSATAAAPFTVKCVMQLMLSDPAA
jgi:hypothetical protein